MSVEMISIHKSLQVALADDLLNRIVIFLDFAFVIFVNVLFQWQWHLNYKVHRYHFSDSLLIKLFVTNKNCRTISRRVKFVMSFMSFARVYPAKLTIFHLAENASKGPKPDGQIGMIQLQCSVVNNHVFFLGNQGK